MQSLVEALGRPPDARLLILSSDLLGSTHAATEGGLTAMREGSATTGTIMMPGPWSRYAAERVTADDDIGVHLTLNAELDGYRWGPLTSAPSLLDGDGGFPRTATDLWDHADLDEVRRECRAQIERARLWGVEITHLTTHLGALQQRPEFFDVLLDLAVDLELPVRLESAGAENVAGFPFRRLATEDGVIGPDHFRLVRGGARQHLDTVLDALPPGVTEVAFAPALASEELRAVDPAAGGRIDDLTLLLDTDLQERLVAAGVEPIGYRDLREVQRSRR